MQLENRSSSKLHCNSWTPAPHPHTEKGTQASQV